MNRSSKTTLQDRCRAIEMLVLDVDGVLTAGGITYANDGRELKTFHVRDGSGLKIWEYLGKCSAIITGRTSPIVNIRAKEIGVATVVQGAVHKMPAYRQLLKDSGLQSDQICFVGDDVPDLPILLNCGLAVAPADACPDVLKSVDFVTKACAGQGAVREVVELILRCQGLWQKLLDDLCGQTLAEE
jgi:3-deoxy-D-manno-octulosonate 8-phosphate phosphatase (KDO 8-P phosphatase)